NRSPSPSPVLLPHQPHHSSAKSRRLGSRASPSRTAMLQPFGPFLPIPLPQPLRLPVTYSHQARCIPHLQFFVLHSRQHFHSKQFPLAHPDSAQGSWARTWPQSPELGSSARRFQFRSTPPRQRRR